MDLERILAEGGLAAVDYHEEIPSTNSRALELIAAGESRLPLLVLANRQSAGRGRGQNRWWSGPDGLTFSLLVDTAAWQVPSQNWPLVSMATGWAISEALAALLPNHDVRIKWPNDVYVNGRKIAGILVETSARHPGVMVIGIGLNVNNSLAAAPPELQSLATSLVDLARRPFDRTAVLLEVLRQLLPALTELTDETWQRAEAWRQRCYLQGRTVEIEVGERRVAGVCQGIDDLGALLLVTEGGIQRFVGGVVRKIL